MGDEMGCTDVGCTACCRWMTFVINTGTDANLAAKYAQFYRARGCTVKVLTGATIAIMVPKACPHLIEDGCAIYDDRPLLCREYDGRYDPFMAAQCKLPKKVNE